MGTAENKRSVIVGIFVFIGVVIFVLGVYTLGGQQKKFVQSVRLKAIFTDSEGLKIGNNVRFSGVKIGTIKEIRFFGESQVEIVMNIEKESRKYVHKDAKARIGSESLIGNKNIIIYGGSPNVPAVEDGDVLQTEKMLGTEEIMETLQENNKNLVSITNDFKTITAKMAQGEGTAGALLTDSAMARDMRQTIANLQLTAATTARASQALSQFTTRLNNREGMVNKLLTDTVVFNRLQQSVNQLDQTTASARETADNLKQATSKLQAKDNALGVLLNDEDFAARMKSTMGNLETGTQKLDENMEAMQHNFLLRGFFKKQEKEKQKNKSQDKTFR